MLTNTKQGILIKYSSNDTNLSLSVLQNSEGRPAQLRNATDFREIQVLKMSGETPEVRSDKRFNLIDIQNSIKTI